MGVCGAERAFRLKIKRKHISLWQKKLNNARTHSRLSIVSLQGLPGNMTHLGIGKCHIKCLSHYLMVFKIVHFGMPKTIMLRDCNFNLFHNIQDALY